MVVQKKARVLFVDDEKNILLVLRAMFATQYEVLTAESGAAALALIRRTPVDVIVSDQRMPKMLGHELLRQVRQISPGTMRLLITGYTERHAILHAINEGEVFRFLYKPWDNDVLRATLEQTIAIAQETAEGMATVASLVEEPPADVSKAGILVMGNAQATFARVRSMCAPHNPVYRAISMDTALQCLERETVGVLITDVTVGAEPITAFLTLLKQACPAVITIVITAAEAETPMMTSLINQARVYRYLSQDVSDDLLRKSIRQGLSMYQAHGKHPRLVQRQRVEVVPTLNNAAAVRRYLERFKALPTRAREFASP